MLSYQDLGSDGIPHLVAKCLHFVETYGKLIICNEIFVQQFASYRDVICRCSSGALSLSKRLLARARLSSYNQGQNYLGHPSEKRHSRSSSLAIHNCRLSADNQIHGFTIDYE